MPPLPLAGFTVAITADRRADEQAALLERRGATVLHGPTIETLPLTDDPTLSAAIDATISRPPDIVVATTGIGVRSWMEAADGRGAGDRLRGVIRRAEVLARSPKAAGALVTAGLPCHWQAPDETSTGLVERLADRNLDGVRIAVQRDGAEVARLARRLSEMGAEVIDVPVYRSILPADPAPAHRLLDALAERQVDAVTITSAPALTNLMSLADLRGESARIRHALAHEVLVACVGPVCAARARAEGATRVVEPDRFRLGSMVRVLTEALATTGWSLAVDGLHLRVQGCLALVNSEEIGLARREGLVLDRLAAAGGGVVPKSELARTVWGPEVDHHVVEVTIGRLRHRLGRPPPAVVTVPRRGYRLAAAPTSDTRSAARGAGSATIAASESAGRGPASHE